MSFIEATKIYIQAILKISYEFGLSLLILIVLMGIASLIKGDKYLFIKLYKKFRRYIFND